MDKVLEDIEELKDKNRDMYYNGNGVKIMIETIVALLMFLNGV